MAESLYATNIVYTDDTFIFEAYLYILSYKTRSHAVWKLKKSFENYMQGGVIKPNLWKFAKLNLSFENCMQGGVI